MGGIQLIPSASITATALEAERTRLMVASSNLANAHSTKGPNGKMYERLQPIFSSILKDSLDTSANSLGGVRVDAIVADKRTPLDVYAPYHPMADKNGMIKTPDIAPMEEMIDIITATRAYEANLSAMKQARDMANKTINIDKA